MDIYFYSFSKRENSTKIPANVAKIFNCKIKDESGIIFPQIMLSDENLTLYNYAYIPKWHRYYFVKDWVYNRGVWTGYLSADVLASYRTQIMASSQYVLRSASEYDGSIIDTMYPAKSGAVSNGSVFGNFSGWPALPGGIVNGTFVVGIVAPQPWLSTEINPYGLQYVAMTSENFTKLMTALLTSDNTAYSGFWQDSLKASFNPFQYIVSVKWFPYYVTANPLTTAKTGLKLGWFTFSEVSYYMPLAAETFSITMPEIAGHPQAEARGEYLNRSPYRNIYCYLPGAGTISLDGDIFNGIATVRCDVDTLTGQARYYVFSGGVQIASVDCEIGVSVPISQITVNSGKAILDGLGAAVGVAASAASGNIAGVISGAISGIGNAIDTIVPQAQSRGTQGTRGILTQNPSIQIWSTVRTLVDSDNDDLGRPLCKKVTLNTLSGYCMVSDADIAIAATAEENRSIKQYMEGGFFLE